MSFLKKEKTEMNGRVATTIKSINECSPVDETISTFYVKPFDGARHLACCKKTKNNGGNYYSLNEATSSMNTAVSSTRVSATTVRYKDKKRMY